MVKKLGSFVCGLTTIGVFLSAAGCGQDNQLQATESTTETAAIVEKSSAPTIDLPDFQKASTSLSSTTSMKKPQEEAAPQEDTVSKRPTSSAPNSAAASTSVQSTEKKTEKQESSIPKAPGQTPTAYFSTLSPGSALPSGEECANRVRPTPETVPENQRYNQTVGRKVVGETYLSRDIEAGDFEARIDGNFTGTTDEILQWGACKWGFDEDLIRAQAQTESSFFAGKLGDCGENALAETTSAKSGGCSSVGLLQVRGAGAPNPVHYGTFPMAWESTAFNVDYTYALMRSCFEGREVWLNDTQSSVTYGAGDFWGCQGRHFSGNWHDPAAKEYMRRVEANLQNRVWENANAVGCKNPDESFYCA